MSEKRDVYWGNVSNPRQMPLTSCEDIETFGCQGFYAKFLAFGRPYDMATAEIQKAGFLNINCEVKVPIV